MSKAEVIAISRTYYHLQHLFYLHILDILWRKVEGINHEVSTVWCGKPKPQQGQYPVSPVLDARQQLPSGCLLTKAFYEALQLYNQRIL